MMYMRPENKAKIDTLRGLSLSFEETMYAFDVVRSCACCHEDAGPIGLREHTLSEPAAQQLDEIVKQPAPAGGPRARDIPSVTAKSSGEKQMELYAVASERKQLALDRVMLCDALKEFVAASDGRYEPNVLMLPISSVPQLQVLLGIDTHLLPAEILGVHIRYWSKEEIGVFLIPGLPRRSD